MTFLEFSRCHKVAENRRPRWLQLSPFHPCNTSPPSSCLRCCRMEPPATSRWCKKQQKRKATARRRGKIHLNLDLLFRWFFWKSFSHGLHHHFSPPPFGTICLYLNFFQTFFTSKSKSRTFFLLVENKEAFMFNKAHYGGIHLFGHIWKIPKVPQLIPHTGWSPSKIQI